MKIIIQVLIVILLLLLITALGLHLYKNILHREPATSEKYNGIIGQTLNYSNFTKAAKFSSVIATLNLLKQQVVVFQAQNGDWPESLTDIDLSQDDLAGEKYIDSILIQKGSIYANIESEFKKNATVRFAPSEGMGGATIKWLCETNTELRQVNYCSFNNELRYPMKTETAQ